MSDATSSASTAQDSPKKSSAKKVAKPRTKATHPPTAEMVMAAVKDLKERNGSSLQAIKKYMAATYKVEVEKMAPFIKKYLKNAVDSKTLVRTKGKGASGSFKLPTNNIGGKPKPKPKKTTKTLVKKTTAVTKKPASPKKSNVDAKKAVAAKKPTPTKKVIAKKPAAKKTVAAAAKPAAPKRKKSMAKKTVKSPAKPKAPKAKKASPTKAKTASKRK